MEEKILTFSRPIVYYESIAHFEVHAHLPYAPSTFNNSDDIRISVQNQDHCHLPSKSSLHIQGKLVKEDGTSITNATFIINAIYHLFEEARYELNTVETDNNKNVGLTNLIKNYTSVYKAQKNILKNAGWFPSSNANILLTDNAGIFDVSIPLNTIFGFDEDYQKTIVNATYELIFR